MIKFGNGSYINENDTDKDNGFLVLRVRSEDALMIGDAYIQVSSAGSRFVVAINAPKNINIKRIKNGSRKYDARRD